MRLLAAIAFTLAASVLPALAADTQSAGREQSEALLAGNFEGVWEDMTPQMQQAFGTIEGLKSFGAALERDFGTEVEVVSEAVQPGGPGVELYVRTSKWSAIEAPILMQWAFDTQFKVVGFLVQPVATLADSRFLEYQTKAELQLPVTDEWFVVWGGRTLEQNYHAADRAQRFATDMLIFRDGVTHSGDAGKLESYYCWHQPILSPGAGTVVTAVNDLPDNPIGETDPRNPAGNHVVIDLGNSEFAFLGHMRQGSVAVAAGDTVAAGDELGRCGNSGNTSEPHLHMHLQTTTDLATGEGLPAQFIGYFADGVVVARGEPQAGQFVSR